MVYSQNDSLAQAFWYIQPHLLRFQFCKLHDICKQHDHHIPPFFVWSLLVLYFTSHLMFPLFPFLQSLIIYYQLIALCPHPIPFLPPCQKNVLQLLMSFVSVPHSRPRPSTFLYISLTSFFLYICNLFSCCHGYCEGSWSLSANMPRPWETKRSV